MQFENSKDSRDDEIVQLIVKHQSALRAFLVSLMPGNSNVEDLMQETSMLIWQKRGEFELGSDFKAWMFSVAHFRTMAYWRDQKRSKESSMPDELLNQLADQAEESGFEGIDRRYQYLLDCIQILNPQDRGLVLRRHASGMNPGKVAKELGRTSNSVRVSLHRVRSVLKTCIERKVRMEKSP